MMEGAIKIIYPCEYLRKVEHLINLYYYHLCKEIYQVFYLSDLVDNEMEIFQAKSIKRYNFRFEGLIESI